tara:strand:+ start:2003 stop:2596 length:594 start_codon:yes stop_codon:yes gene_type:complete
MNLNTKISDLILRENSLVSEKDCKFFIDTFEKYKNLSVPELSYKNKSKTEEKDNYKCLPLSNLYNLNNDIKKAADLAFKYIEIMINKYVAYIQKTVCKTYDSTCICTTNTIRLLKYEKGEFIKDHTDVNTSTRASCSLNLNSNYIGGEFRFFDGKIKHSFNTGDAIIFPAEPIWIHGTEPIKKGTRYTINCFLNSKN